MRFQINHKYKEIWDKAFPYQDFRNDKGHAFIVTIYAQEICRKEKCNMDVVIPAAILHDTGWSQLPLEERMSVFKYGVPKEERLRIREAHQRESVKIASDTLKSINYPENIIAEILEIISQHDTREGFISDNEGAMRDADKLWRFDDYGFLNDNQNSGLPFNTEIQSLEKKLKDPTFLYFDSSKETALKLIENLKKKYLN